MDPDRVAPVRLANGLFTVVDREDYDYVKDYNWNINHEGFISSGTGSEGTLVYLHLLLGPEKEGDCGELGCEFVVHANRNKLDNRRSNLVPASRSQSNAQRGLRADNTSGAKGVSFDKRRGQWRVQVTHQGKVYFGGRHDTLEAATEAYDNKLKELFGAFAHTNADIQQSA